MQAHLHHVLGLGHEAGVEYSVCPSHGVQCKGADRVIDLGHVQGGLISHTKYNGGNGAATYGGPRLHHRAASGDANQAGQHPVADIHSLPRPAAGHKQADI